MREMNKKKQDRFTVKNGYLIKKVVKRETTLFEVTDEKYLDRVIVYIDSQNQRKIKFLAPGEIETYDDVETSASHTHSPAKPQPSSQAQSISHVETAVVARPKAPSQSEAQRSHASPSGQTQSAGSGGVTFIDLDVKVQETTEYIDYYYYEDEQVHRFVCKQGYLIGKIKKGDRLIFEYNKDYPNRAIVFKDENGKSAVRAIAPGTSDPKEPTYIPGGQDQSGQGHASPPKAQAPKAQQQQNAGQPEVIELELNTRETTDKVIYEKNDEKQYERYTCKPGFLISKILKNGKVARQAASNEYFNRALVTGPKGQRELTPLLPGDIDKTAEKFVLELNKRETTDEYIYKKNDKEREKYTCRSGFLISKILKNGKDVSIPPKDDYYDRAIVYKDDQGQKQLTTLFPGQDDKDDPDEPTAIHTILGLTGKPKSAQAPAPLKVAPAHEQVESQPEEPPSQPTLKASPAAQQTSEAAGPEEPTEVEESTSSKEKESASRIAVRLDINKTTGSETYTYKKSGNINTFIPKDNYGFYMVKQENTVLWETQDPKKYSKRVDYSTNSFTQISEVRIDMFDDEQMRFVREPGSEWKTANVIKLNPVTVNIKIRTSNNHFDSTSHGNYRYFLPKTAIGFNRVIESGGIGGMGGSESSPAIWQANDRNEYAIKIIRDGSGLAKSITEMTIYLINGEEKKFKKSGETWAEIQAVPV